MTPYKSPIKHTDNRLYYFYNYSEDGLKLYMANKKVGERENRIILVDKCGETVGDGFFRDHRRRMG